MTDTKNDDVNYCMMKPIIPVAIRKDEFESVHKDFDAALAHVDGVKRPDYGAFLRHAYNSKTFDLDDGAWVGKREVADSYPAEMAGMEYGPKRVDKLYAIAEETLREAGVLNYVSSNGVYFKVGDRKNLPDVYAKLYGCVKTSEAFNFARKIGGWRGSGSEFSGKFYPVWASFAAHSKLCMYVPFEELAGAIGLLEKEKELFHKADFNHPAGLHVFPGLSAVITANETDFDSSFDTMLVYAIQDVRNENFGSEDEFVRRAKGVLENDPVLAYHFRYLADKGD